MGGDAILETEGLTKEHNLFLVSALPDTITVLARGEILAEDDEASEWEDPRVVVAYLASAHA